MKISVITPCYGPSAKFLAEAYASVAVQNYVDWEMVIAVGDVESERVAKSIAYDDPRIRVVPGCHKGQAHAKNEAIRVSRGNLILPLDADDKLAPDFMERFMAVHTGQRNEIIGCWVQNFGDSKVIYVPPPWSDIKTSNPLSNTSMYSRTMWEAAGGYDVAILGFEDWELWIKCSKLHPKVTMIPEPLFLYRTHPEQGMEAERGLYDIWKAMLRLRHPDLWPTRRYLDEQLVRVSPEAVQRRFRQRLAFFPDNPTLLQWEMLLP